MAPQYGFGGAGAPGVPPGRTSLTNPNVIVILNPADRVFDVPAADAAADAAVAGFNSVADFFDPRVLTFTAPTLPPGPAVGGGQSMPNDPPLIPVWTADP